MFATPQARYVLRCVLFGVSALLVSLQASASGGTLDQGAVVNAVIASALVALGYAGVGAASKSVEPSIGNKR